MRLRGRLRRAKLRNPARVCPLESTGDHPSPGADGSGWRATTTCRRARRIDAPGTTRPASDRSVLVEEPTQPLVVREGLDRVAHPGQRVVEVERRRLREQPGGGI